MRVVRLDEKCFREEWRRGGVCGGNVRVNEGPDLAGGAREVPDSVGRDVN